MYFGFSHGQEFMNVHIEVAREVKQLWSDPKPWSGHELCTLCIADRREPDISHHDECGVRALFISPPPSRSYAFGLNLPSGDNLISLGQFRTQFDKRVGNP
jgi:hypothetical protein